MRVLVDSPTNSAIQVEKTPEVGSLTPINGQYVLTIPEGASVDIDAGSYVLPVDGGDISNLAFASLLARYPMYTGIAFNPLLTAADAADLDLTATLPTGEACRAQVGRGAGPLPVGISPNSVALLPINSTIASTPPGLLITDTIDISAIVPAGASEFMVYWKLYGFSTTEDIAADYGLLAGTNSAAVRSVVEVDQEPAALAVYLSNDDGITYTQVGRMEPVAFCVPGTLLRIAFRNDGTSKLYIACYAVLF